MTDNIHMSNEYAKAIKMFENWKTSNTGIPAFDSPIVFGLTDNASATDCNKSLHKIKGGENVNC